LPNRSPEDRPSISWSNSFLSMLIRGSPYRAVTTPEHKIQDSPGPWRSFDAVEYATLEWVDWFNNRRLLEPIGSIPPAEAEANFYAALETSGMAA
ncbi:hypothetical protein ACGYLB_17745, partial [Sulfitobacter sp. S45]